MEVVLFLFVICMLLAPLFSLGVVVAFVATLVGVLKEARQRRQEKRATGPAN